MAQFDHTYETSSSESNTSSPTDELMEPSRLLTKNISIVDIIQYHKCSIHHQDAEASIADATDCLRMITGKMEWFQRKHQFCPHLFSNEDAQQITSLHQRLLIEEIPFLELKDRLRNGLNVDIPRELQGRITSVCQKFDELKLRFDNLLSNVNQPSISMNPTTTTVSSINNGAVIEV
ncbi:hypothetical protein BLA29_007384 [Euroglyphus maynei]|uniref:Uncharacterized protein n=1 Tax=Euroglyphus maynei TaxID=6958 RepID=A0A1Y3B2I9_EURMA|nr:hypothetical protein BLA29_007384 [Euroglyphus maynei]